MVTDLLSGVEQATLAALGKTTEGLIHRIVSTTVTCGAPSSDDVGALEDEPALIPPEIYVPAVPIACPREISALDYSDARESSESFGSERLPVLSSLRIEHEHKYDPPAF